MQRGLAGNCVGVEVGGDDVGAAVVANVGAAVVANVGGVVVDAGVGAAVGADVGAAVNGDVGGAVGGDGVPGFEEASLGGGPRRR